MFLRNRRTNRILFGDLIAGTMTSKCKRIPIEKVNQPKQIATKHTRNIMSSRFIKTKLESFLHFTDEYHSVIRLGNM